MKNKLHYKEVLLTNFRSGGGGSGGGSGSGGEVGDGGGGKTI